MRNMFAAIFGILLLVLSGCQSTSDQASASLYTCPMHPEYIVEQQGDCPICHMRLIPLKEFLESTGGQAVESDHAMDPEHEAGTAHCGADAPSSAEASACTPSPSQESPPPKGLANVALTPQGIQLAGIVTAPAASGGFTYSIRAVGYVVPDETRVVHFHTRVAGWVQQLMVNYVGQHVRKGDPVLAIYSPELYSAQDEFLISMGRNRDLREPEDPYLAVANAAMVASARRKLELLGLEEAAIKALEEGGEARREVVLHASGGGVVTSKEVLEGHQVEPGMTLLTLSDLSRVWLEAEFYENEARFVTVGGSARVTFPYLPGKVVDGKITYVAPNVTPESRTIRARIELDNKDLLLKVGMFANVDLQIHTGEGVVVPDSAILDTGVRQLVYVDIGMGRFAPREVKAGVRHMGQAQILEGLAAGENVVVNGTFLLDSESRIRASRDAAAQQRSEKESGGTP